MRLWITTEPGMRVYIATKVFILLNREGDTVRVLTDKTDIKYSVLGPVKW